MEIYIRLVPHVIPTRARSEILCYAKIHYGHLEQLPNRDLFVVVSCAFTVLNNKRKY